MPCRATCLDIVGLENKGGRRVNDARNEARVVDLGKMASVLASRGTMQDYSCMWLVDWRKPKSQVPSLRIGVDTMDVCVMYVVYP